VFGDFPDLYAATSTLDPAAIKWVAIDSTAAPCSIPSGGPWDLDQFKFYNSIPSNANETILAEPGAIITFRELELHDGIFFSSVATSSPIVVASGQLSALRMYNGQAQAQVGAAPFVHVESGGQFGLHMFEANTIVTGAPFIQSDVGADVDILMFDRASVQASTLSGAGPVAVTSYSPAAVFSATQPGFTGALTWTWDPIVSIVQGHANTGTGTGTVTASTTSIQRQKSGIVSIQANVLGVASAPCNLTVTISRDAGVIIAQPPQALAAGALRVAIPIMAVDILPDNGPHTYTITASVDGGATFTVGTNGANIVAIEQ